MEADYGMTAFAMDQQANRTFSQDENLIVHFQMKPHPDHEASLKEGRPIFKSREYITIIVPGDKNNITCRPVWQQDLQRFPKQYAAFKNQQDQQVTGTPLESVVWISREQVEELKHFHIKTLENLANCPDVHAQKFMGINALRQRARDHIAAAKDLAPQAQLRAEIEKRDAQLEENARLMKAMEARIEALEAAEEEEE